MSLVRLLETTTSRDSTSREYLYSYLFKSCCCSTTKHYCNGEATTPLEQPQQVPHKWLVYWPQEDTRDLLLLWWLLISRGLYINSHCYRTSRPPPTCTYATYTTKHGPQNKIHLQHLWSGLLHHTSVPWAPEEISRSRFVGCEGVTKGGSGDYWWRSEYDFELMTKTVELDEVQ